MVRAAEGEERDAFADRLRGTLSSQSELYVTEPGPREATAVVCSAEDPGFAGFRVRASYEVDDELVWDEPIAGAVYSMFAFFRPPPGVEGEEFVSRYREHSEVARVHHPGVRRYVQDIVSSQSGEARWMCAAISELHFAGPDEFRDRFWLDEASREIVQRDFERFSDPSTAKTVVAPRIALRG